MNDKLKALAASAQTYPVTASEDLLERFELSFSDPEAAGMDIEVLMPEFTCLCPITGQPDYASFKLTYRPDGYAVESKSLKLYLGSYRMTGAFHERGTIRIGEALVALLSPKWLSLEGSFNARGGISFKTHYRYEK
jgi:7-cyano-7-deazaguanine reductase